MKKLFIAHSNTEKDLFYLRELEKHLSVLVRQGKINPWHSEKLSIGQEVADVTTSELNAADAILLLLSPDFIASDYINNEIVSVALKRTEQAQTVIMPVLLRSCLWQDGVLDKFHQLPSDGIPIAEQESLDDAFRDLVVDILKVLTGEDIDKATLVKEPENVKQPPKSKPGWLLPIMGGTIVISIATVFWVKRSALNKSKPDPIVQTPPVNNNPDTAKAKPPTIVLPAKELTVVKPTIDLNKLNDRKVKISQDGIQRLQFKRIIGFIRDKKTNTPLSGVRVKFNEDLVISNTEGEFNIRIPLNAPATARIFFSKPGYEDYNEYAVTMSVTPLILMSKK